MDDLRELPPCFWDMDGKCSRIAASWHLPREPTLGEAQSCESRRRGSQKRHGRIDEYIICDQMLWHLTAGTCLGRRWRWRTCARLLKGQESH